MVTAVTAASLNFLAGHPKKQDKTPTTGTPAGTVGSDTAGDSDTSAASPATTGTTLASGTSGTYSGTGATVSADPAGSPSAAKPVECAADNHAATSGTQAPRLGAVPETAENRIPNLPMTPRLREMIAQLKSPLPIPIGLHRFTTDLGPEFDMPAGSRRVPQAQQVKRDMIADPATSLVAQANFDRHDVIALLGLQGGGAATLN